MADEAQVIAEVQTDAAQTVADRVTEVVAVTDGMIVAEVGQVGSQLAEHAATSEERHEQILEEVEEWQSAVQQLNAGQLSLQSNLLAFQTSQQAQNQAILAELQTLNQRLSTASPPSIQTPPPAEVAVVEPESVEVDLQAAPPPPAAQRRRRVI